MYQQPMAHISELIKLKPALVIIHYEAEVDHLAMAKALQAGGLKAGIALLPDTPASSLNGIISSFDHVLIFSGHLGYHGGQADLNLISKVEALRQASSSVEIAWDGGINEQNALRLKEAGVKVLNVGGFIMGAPDPASAYAKIKNIVA
jgi:ribulose-phosphate 3-epimerase